MLQSVKELNGYAIQARDGVLGTVDELLFDDEEWLVRYLVVDISDLILNRRVLIGVEIVDWIDSREQRIKVRINRDEVLQSPELNQDMPVSRQYETALRRYYEWPIYWGQNEFLDTEQTKGLASQIPDEDENNSDSAERIIPGITDEQDMGSDLGLQNYPLESDEEEVREMEFAGPEEEIQETSSSSHLRSSRELASYRVMADEMSVGYVEDFLIDSSGWNCRYLVVTPQNRQGGRPLVPFHLIRKISWSLSQINVEASRDAIRRSPRIDPARPISPNLEREALDYYDRLEY
jgi:hypothetical protein